MPIGSKSDQKQFTPDDIRDLAWATPCIETARAVVACGHVLNLSQHRAAKQAEQ
jgi:hypothetical protein